MRKWPLKKKNHSSKSFKLTFKKPQILEKSCSKTNILKESCPKNFVFMKQ